MTDYYPAIHPAVRYCAGSTLETRLALHDEARSMLRNQLRQYGFGEDAIKDALTSLEAALDRGMTEVPPPPPKRRRIRLITGATQADADARSADWNRKKHEAALTPLKLAGQFVSPGKIPGLMLPAILEVGDQTREGVLITDVAEVWLLLLDIIRKDPTAIFQIGHRETEELVAGAYHKLGYKVELTPRNRDKGRDVIATREGIGTIRIFDQVKAYRPGHLVTAEQVRAMLFVIDAGRASKGFISTTSTFAPEIMYDEYIAPLIPGRLVLRDHTEFLPWLLHAASKKIAQ